MFKFAALLWNPHDIAQCNSAETLVKKLGVAYGTTGVVLQAQGLRVYCARTGTSLGNTYPLQGNRGIVLGQIFPGRRSSDGFDATETALIAGSCGQHLLRKYWGRYVAFLYDPDSFTIRVIRDPTAALPCFMTEVHGVHLVFSNIEDSDQLGLTFTIDWDWVTAQLSSAVNERLDGTALREVRRVHGAECIAVSPQGIRSTFYWDPYDIARNDIIEDPQEAVESVREVVSNCVHMWASCYESIIHRLSGGLDSSIVAFCLGSAPSVPKVTCFNHYSAGAESDERRYARLAAGAARLPLIEHPRDSTINLEQLYHLPRYPYPLYCRYSLNNASYETDLARRMKATAVFSGEWGDAVFNLPCETDSALDYVSRHKFGRRTFQVALDASRLDGRSVWSVLSEALRQGTRRPKHWDQRARVLSKYRSLLTADAIARAKADTRFVHPWLRRDIDVPIGKFKHIYDCLLLDLGPLNDPLGGPDSPEHVAPLSSQPLIELGLRIPTYVSTLGGWSRAIARRAFAGRVPDEIITRRTKGGIISHQKSLLMNNIRLTHDFLMDGELVRRHIVDRQKLEAALQSEPTTLSTMVPELQWYLYTEAWVASWRGHQRSLAA